MDDSDEGVDRDWDDAVAGPRFCARCRLDAAAHESICGHCGDRIVARGYCPVCESYWKLPVDAHCPKHDLVLEGGPRRSPGFAPGTRWVTLRTFNDPLDAEGPRLRLEAEGIPTFLEGSRMATRSMYQLATGGTKLQVPEPLVHDARILLDQSWNSPTIEEDLEDAWDQLEPESGRRRRSVMRGLVYWFLFGPLVLSILALLIRSCEVQAPAPGW
ncbi:MAG: hypothetical protein AB7I30_02045 [Isosphaeraceae bacterium]